MLMMENLSERKQLKKYFYDEKSSILFGICLLLVMPTFGISLLIYLIIRIAQLFIGADGDEKLYDRLLESDLDFLKKRSVNTMGLVEEEFSLIDPIVAHGYAQENEVVKTGMELQAEKKNGLELLKDALLAIPRVIISFFRQLFGEKDYISHAVFFEGHDKKVRGSLVSMTVITFTEQQIVSYTCNYDIALGVILEEHVREVFYRDVDSVNYGDETMHIILKDGKLLRTPVTWIRMAVASGKDIFGSMIGETDLLDNQIMAAKSLIRSKKEEMA